MFSISGLFFLPSIELLTDQTSLRHTSSLTSPAFFFLLLLLFFPGHRGEISLEITMHLTAVVLILVVTGIAEGNVRFFDQSSGTSDKNTDTNTERFVSIYDKQTPLWKRVEKSTRDAYFMALNVSCVVGFLGDISFDASTLLLLSLSVSCLKGWDCNAGCNTENGFCEKPGKCRYRNDLGFLCR